MGYLTELQNTIQSQIDLLDCLKKRVDILTNRKHDDEYLSNEDKIQIIKTNAEISSLSQIIVEKQNYFVKYAKDFDEEYALMENNYDMVMKTANVMASGNDNLNRLLKTPDLQHILNDKEAKLYFYKRVLSFINEK